MTHESLSGDSVEATPYKNPRTLGPETQMLNLRILQNLAQNNIYRDETSKEGVRVLERALLGEGRRYKPGEAAAAAQMSLEDARRIWRNMGFPDIHAADPHFTELGVNMLEDLENLNRTSLVAEESIVSLTRSVGQLTDRIVAWQIETLVHDIMDRDGVDDAQARRQLLFRLADLMPVLEELALYAYRRQMYTGVLRLALRENKKLGPEPAQLPLVRGVGFVDLVSYTSLVRNLSAPELARLINRFEQSCLDIIAPSGGRIIKTLGDEVFFLTEAPEAIAEISLKLAEQIGKDPELPEVRVAFIWGEVLANRGDVYGSSVNLASRLVSLAEPGSVLTDSETAETLKEYGDRFTLTYQGTRNVRSFGNVDPVAVTPGASYITENDTSWQLP